VTRLPILPPDEYGLVTAGFNATAHQRDAATLGRRFVAQAGRTPDATALVFEGEHRSYAQLLERARRIAGGLARAGVRAGDVVGVRLSRGFGLYETIHALALLGAVYCPIDPELPPARIEAMLTDAGVVQVVDDPDALAGGEPYLGEPPDEPDAPAYLLFTSGSTGRPKGVAIGHRAIDNRLAWMQHHLRLQPGERVLHKTPISFDVSIWELYWPLQVGATVVIAPPGAHRDPRALAELIVVEDVAVLHVVPSMLRAFLADRPARERVAAARLRQLVASGEALTPELVAGSLKWFGVAPTNLYGPTEAAVDVTVWDCTAADAAEGHSVPIGRPIWNTSCFVLDAALRPVGVGVTGELWLGGVQLADGYRGRPELTAERFVETAWGRLYRTGDLAAWRPDGALRYLGRTDDQVKIRGQRIELGEVEAALSGPGIELAAGVLESGAHSSSRRTPGSSDTALAVWFVASPEDADEAREALRAAAAEALPPSLVPTRWIAVDAIPLTPSGKTDRRALVELAARQPAPAASAVAGEAPRDLLQQRVAAVIAEVLGLAAVPVDADFFALGGDSLSVLRLLGRLADDLGADIGLAEAFAHPTAAGLAGLVAGTGRDRLGRLRRGADPAARRGPAAAVPVAAGRWAGLVLHRPARRPAVRPRRAHRSGARHRHRGTRAGGRPDRARPPPVGRHPHRGGRRPVPPGRLVAGRDGGARGGSAGPGRGPGCRRRHSVGRLSGRAVAPPRPAHRGRGADRHPPAGRPGRTRRRYRAADPGTGGHPAARLGQRPGRVAGGAAGRLHRQRHRGGAAGPHPSARGDGRESGRGGGRRAASRDESGRRGLASAYRR
jgi:L-serine---[L-seryl-carrier protein] ligase